MHTQTLGVRESSVCVRPWQPLPLAVHTEGLPTAPVPLAGSVLAVLVTLQARLVLLAVGDAWNQGMDTMTPDRPPGSPPLQTSGLPVFDQTPKSRAEPDTL